MTGCELRMPAEAVTGEIQWMNTDERVSKMLHELAIAKKLVDKDQNARLERNRKAYNNGRHHVEVKKGEKVYLYSHKKPAGTAGKIWRRWNGPYTVTAVNAAGL